MITKLRSPPIAPSYPKQMWDYLQEGLVFTVLLKIVLYVIPLNVVNFPV